MAAPPGSAGDYQPQARSARRGSAVVLRRVVSLAVLVVAGLLLACLRAGQGAVIELESRDAPMAASPAQTVPSAAATLTFAVSAVNSPYASFGAYERLAAYLAGDLGLEKKFVGNHTYSEIVSMVRSREATLALVCGAPYVFGQNEFGMELLAVPVVDGETSAKSYLIVRESNKATTWTDLRGAVFGFTDPLSYGGRLIPVAELRKRSERPESFFGRTLYTYSHDNSIEAVAKGLVDAASVNSVAYERARARGAANGTKVIWESTSYPVAPIVVHPDLDPQLKARLRDLLLSLDESDVGREILKALGFDRFVVIDDFEYDGIRRLINELSGSARR